MKMSRASLAAAALAVAVALPVLAQPVPSRPGSGAPPYGYTPPPGTPVTPDDQGAQGAVPPVGRQIQAARSVSSSAPGRQPADLLHQADRALTQRKVAAANELLERAQTAVLNTAQAGDDNSGKMTSAIGSARQAVVADNMAEAHQRIADALGMLPAGAAQPVAAPPARRHR